MVTIDSGNIYLTSATKPEVASNGLLNGPPVTTITGGTTVQIQVTKIDYNYDNPVSVIPIPVSVGNREETESYSRAIDIKRSKESIAVQGFLIDETDSRAIDKKNNLITLAKDKGGLTAVWGIGNYQTLWTPNVEPYGVFILKMMITETSGLISNGGGFTGDPPPERTLAIQMTLVRGKDM